MRFAASPVVVVLLLAGCAASGAQTVGSGPIKVVAAENSWGGIAAQIGAPYVTVTSLLSDPNADPHEFETTAHDAAALADAQLVVENGLGYDDFISQLLGVTRKSGRIVVNAADAVGTHGNDTNPHLWYSTAYADSVAQAVTDALKKIDPRDAPTFAANLENFRTSVAQIRAVVDQVKSRYGGAPVAYTERVPGYMLADAGLTVKTPPGFAQANEDGSEPSAADAQTMDSLITTGAIKALLYNAQATSAASTRARGLAQQNNIPIIAVTETMPVNEPSYQHWQLDQDRALLAALGG